MYIQHIRESRGLRLRHKDNSYHTEWAQLLDLSLNRLLGSGQRVCGWGSQLRVLREITAYRCPQGPGTLISICIDVQKVG